MWDAQNSEIAELAHTEVEFLGEGIESIAVTGSSWHRTNPAEWHLPRVERRTAPLFRRDLESWTGTSIVLAEKRVQPSVYNTLVEFIYRLSAGDETGAAALLTDSTLLETAQTLGLVQEPLGQEWLISLDRYTRVLWPHSHLAGFAPEGSRLVQSAGRGLANL